MINTRMKLVGVILASCWCILLVYVLSSLNWHPGGNIDLKRSIAGKQQKVFNALHDNAYKLIDEKVDGLHENVVLASRSTPISSNFHNVTKYAKIKNKLKNIKISKLTEEKNIPVLENDNRIKVVICGNSNSIMGVITLINSILKNTKFPVHFFVALPRTLVSHYNEWIKKTNLLDTSQTVRPISDELLTKKPYYAKIFMKNIFPELQGRVIYLSPDVIVQGDIGELNKVKIKSHHYGAFPQDCSSLSKRLLASRPRYSTHIRLDHSILRDKKINPKACTFNTDVFVADLPQWQKYNVFYELQSWFNRSSMEKIYGIDPDVDDGEIAMLIVMYQRTSSLPQMWHIGQLGIRTSSTYTDEVLSKGKLLHWTGHYKPWTGKATAVGFWDKYFLPDPRNKYKPVRKLGTKL